LYSSRSFALARQFKALSNVTSYVNWQPTNTWTTAGSVAGGRPHTLTHTHIRTNAHAIYASKAFGRLSLSLSLTWLYVLFRWVVWKWKKGAA